MKHGFSAPISDGILAEIKIVKKLNKPIKYFTIVDSKEIKEISKNKGQKIVYELNAEKKGKLFGMFNVRKKVMTQVDSENGEIIGGKGPWWGFLVSDNEW